MVKRALLVLPTYNWSSVVAEGRPDADVAATVVRVLEQLALIPSSLQMYGREHDYDGLKAVLIAKGFAEEDIIGDADVRVTTGQFKRSVSKLVCECNGENDVLVIAFCGHGCQELYTRHASLVFSDNCRVSSEWLDGQLRQTPASVYLVLNCCMAAGLPIMAPNGSQCVPSAGPAGLEALQLLSQPTLGRMPLFTGVPRRVDIFSTTGDELQEGLVNGTRFVKSLAAVINDAATVRVEELQGKLTAWKQANMPASTTTFSAHPRPMHSPVVITNGFGGELFGTLDVMPKVRTLKCLPPCGALITLDEWPDMWH